ncbi:transposase family protein [Streptomyces chromofuscus]|uniref:transposase family protein n=1 Tax=Streptomyces chromofuscus TaxID=42881 RepID=UPI001D15B555|nr:transposase family protein [Streptomyces chromofuscus]
MLAQLGRTSAPVPLTDTVALSGFLGLLPYPRGVRGRRYRLSALVTAAAASVLAGARRLTAITEWICNAPAWACRALGFPVDPLTDAVSVPHPHTLRRLLVRLDGDALDRAVGAFLTARAAPADPGCGRSPSTARPCAARAPPPPRTSRCWARWTTTAMSWPSVRSLTRANEIPAFRPLDGTVITADALHTQHAHGSYLRERGAHHIVQVKANHPGLFDRVRRLPWREDKLDHHNRTRAHHRLEIRRLKTVSYAHIHRGHWCRPGGTP